MKYEIYLKIYNYVKTKHLCIINFKPIFTFQL